MSKIFLEIVLAPDYESESLDVLKRKKLENDSIKDTVRNTLEYVKIDAKLLVQQRENCFSLDYQVVTKKIAYL